MLLITVRIDPNTTAMPCPPDGGGIYCAASAFCTIVVAAGVPEGAQDTSHVSPAAKVIEPDALHIWFAAPVPVMVQVSEVGALFLSRVTIQLFAAPGAVLTWADKSVTVEGSILRAAVASVWVTDTFPIHAE